jgi:formate-dependent nitrite reductase membrane component NrfD
MSEVAHPRPGVSEGPEKEQRLTLIQQEAAALVSSRVQLPVASAEKGYYELPMFKEPSWTWEIPLYFFIGGAAGTASVIAGVAKLAGASRKLVRDARRISLAGAMLSPALLISDLGRPARFLAMLRVFKPQSPMSVGVWILMGFSAGTTAANAGAWIGARSLFPQVATLLERTGDVTALTFGLPFASYTGVLIGATVIPAWNSNASLLPAHFLASGLGASVGLLEMAGNGTRALQWLGLGAAAAETAVGAKIELENNPAEAPLKRGPSGWLIRLGGLLSGPVPLALRAVSLVMKPKRAMKLRRYAAAAAVVGSAVTRAAWIYAGHLSARKSQP